MPGNERDNNKDEKTTSLHVDRLTDGEGAAAPASSPDDSGSGVITVAVGPSPVPLALAVEEEVGSCCSSTVFLDWSYNVLLQLITPGENLFLSRMFGGLGQERGWILIPVHLLL